eukprot:COSAG02_NODE_1551_length_11961_cov_19.841173_3_plen_78_part_00
MFSTNELSFSVRPHVITELKPCVGSAFIQTFLCVLSALFQSSFALIGLCPSRGTIGLGTTFVSSILRKIRQLEVVNV